MRDIIVIGAGGHASVIIDIIECMIREGSKIKIKGLLDDKEGLVEFKGYKILDKIQNTKLYNDDNTEFIIAIGNNKIRYKIAECTEKMKYLSAIHPSAIIACDIMLGDGSVVMPRAIINTGSKIGKHVIINSGSIIEHDNIIEDFVHISPGAILCGNVTVKKHTHIGANATLIQGISIGSNSIIGAGSTVIRNVEDYAISVGSPAKVTKNI